MTEQLRIVPPETAPFDRTRSLGGSDVAAVLGLSPWKEPLDCWREKVLHQTDDEKPVMALGKRFEAAVLCEYAVRRNASMRQPGPIVRDWRHASVDAIATVDGWSRVVEAKTVTFADEWGEDGSSHVPPHYEAQGLWYADIAEVDEVDFPILPWPSHPAVLRNLLGLTPTQVAAEVGIRIYTTRYSRVAADRVRSICEAFWKDHVLAEVPPEPRSPAAARRAWWTVAGKNAKATPRVLEILREYDFFRQAEAEAKDQKERRRWQLEQEVGLGTEQVVGPDGWPLATFATIAKKPHMVVPKPYRQLRTTKHFTKLQVANAAPATESLTP